MNKQPEKRYNILPDSEDWKEFNRLCRKLKRTDLSFAPARQSKPWDYWIMKKRSKA